MLVYIFRTSLLWIADGIVCSEQEVNAELTLLAWRPSIYVISADIRQTAMNNILYDETNAL